MSTRKAPRTPNYYLNSLITTLKRKGYAHYIKNQKLDAYIGHIDLIEGEIVLSVDVGISNEQPYYYMEKYVNGELVYEQDTDTINLVTYQADITFKKN